MKMRMTTATVLLMMECMYCPVIANAGENLLKTGQTSIYLNYDDGYYHKGIDVSYSNNGDGLTVTDNVTGLMWPKDGAQAGCNSSGSLVWTSAINWAHGLTFATYSDWRLPNVQELASLLVKNVSQGAPYINKTFFLNTQSGRYWSSTTFPGDSTFALNVDFSAVSLLTNYKTFSYCVRAVRGGL
jgi:hypothetical protein